MNLQGLMGITGTLHMGRGSETQHGSILSSAKSALNFPLAGRKLFVPGGSLKASSIYNWDTKA